MAQNPYTSILYKINPPKKDKLIQKKQLFQFLPQRKDQNGFELSAPLVNKTNDLIEQLNNSFQIFENPRQFQFTFPETLFPSVQPGKKNDINYEQKMIVEEQNIFKDKLSEEQLAQIAQKGQFKVKSNIQYITLPYVWKINQVVFWGKQKVERVWKNSLAKIFGLFYQAKKALWQVAPVQLSRVKSVPRRLFTLIFGSKSLTVAVSTNYQRQIFKQFWKKIMDNYKEAEQWGSALWSYLYVYFDPQMVKPPETRKRDPQFNRRKSDQKQEIRKKYSEQVRESDDKKNKILNAQRSFNQEWAKLKKVIIKEISSQVTSLNNSIDHKPDSEEDLLSNSANKVNNDDKIIQKLAEKKFELYVEHMQKELPKENVPLTVINAIVFLLRLFRVIDLKNQRKNKQRQRRLSQVQQDIKNKHPIKSLYQPFFLKQVNDKMTIIDKELDQRMYQQLRTDSDFTSLLQHQQLEAFRQYVRLRSSYETEEIAKKRQLPELHEPSRIFYSNHHLLPPYQVIEVQNDYDENICYYLKKISDDLTVDTASNFWKFKLYYMRVKTWTINCLIFLVFVVWKGPTGLRCLFGSHQFEYDIQIKYDTGQIYSLNRKTVIGTFQTVLEGIRKSRTQFEETPDLGLLGKNVSRFFNYLECYVFRLVFVGIIITLIGYPCLILVTSTITTILVLTFWAWMPVMLLVTYLFNILIYQFQSGRIPDRFWSRSFPLFGILGIILQSLIIIVLAIMRLIVFVPLASIFILTLSCLQRVFRQLLDKIMLFMFRHLGRSPSRNTAIAKKISGPGMTKEFYMSINEEDVYVLIRAELEKIYLQQFHRLTQQQIQQNKNLSRYSITKILSVFGSYYNQNDYIIQNADSLLASYRTQYNNFIARYPKRPNRVRFTQQQIDSYFDNTVSIVRSFVNKNQINKWIFQDHQLYEDMYEELTRSIWMAVFNCGQEIFEPLQKLDARFSLEDQYSRDYDITSKQSLNQTRKRSVGKVMKALEGEVQLDHTHQKLAPFKHNLLKRETSIEQVDALFLLYNRNSRQQVNLDLNDLKTLFVPNLNINEIITAEKDSRSRDIAAHPNIVDL